MFFLFNWAIFGFQPLIFTGVSLLKLPLKPIRQLDRTFVVNKIGGSVGLPFAVRRIFWKISRTLKGLGSKGCIEVDVVCYENPFQRFLLGIISIFLVVA